MYGTRMHRQSRPRAGRGPLGAPLNWGWSAEKGQMEMMDLRTYLDSIREGYDRALEDLYERVRTVSDAISAAPQAYTAPGTMPREEDVRTYRRHRRDHWCDCGCGHDYDCRCECCIVDADVVVYARCGELRIVPIQIENDTRKVREDVKLEASNARSSGGRPLPWLVDLKPSGPVTLQPCSTTNLELRVWIRCREDAEEEPKVDRTRAAGKATEAQGRDLGALLERLTAGNVDACEVGYVTVRAEGCLVRPIVVAVAVLPDACGRYHAPCSCSCCC